MRGSWLLAMVCLVALPLAGCFGDGDEDWFAPYLDYDETGRTIKLRMTVIDMQNEIYPGFKANLWAFCAEPMDADDAVSRAAIEYQPVSEFDGIGLPPELAAKCSVPGPTIRVQQGDRVIVEFSHSHFHRHTIHWHGQFVPWESDGAPGMTQESVPAGGTFTYDFIAKRAGTLWYHCHVDTQLHVMQGLYGAFIVEPQTKKFEVDVDKEYVFVLSTLRRDLVEAVPGVGLHNHPPGCRSGENGCQNPAWDVTPDTWMINGHSYPVTTMVDGEDIDLGDGRIRDTGAFITMREGQALRIRLINVGETFETIHPHGHDMLVTHRDGNPLHPSARFWVDTLTIGPAERYDVIMFADNPGPWMMHTHVNSHETNDRQAPGGMHTHMVYEEWLEEYGDPHTVFPHELAGGMALPERIEMPEDVYESWIDQLGTGQEVSVSHFFDARLACAVKRVDVTAEVSVGVSALAPLNSFTMSVSGPSGPIFEEELGDDLRANWTIEGVGLKDLVGGIHNVTLAGDAVEATSFIVARVIYHDTFKEAIDQAHRDGTAACPEHYA